DQRGGAAARPFVQPLHVGAAQGRGRGEPQSPGGPGGPGRRGVQPAGGHRQGASVIGVHNPKVKLAASLAVRKYREQHGLLLLEGERLIRQSLAFGARLEYALARVDEVPGALLAELEAAGVEVLPAGPEVIRKVASTQTPQAIVAVAKAVPEDAVDLESAPALIVLDRIQDPGNLGTILRAAAAVGPPGALLSAGAYFRLPLTAGWEPGEAAERLREAGFRLVAADVEGGTDAFAFDWRGKWALVVGNEGNGLDPAFAPAERVTLPMPGGIESLN